MAFIPVPNTAMVETRFTLFGQNIENTLYFENVAAPALADLEALATFMDNWVSVEFLQTFVGQDLIYREVFVTDLTTALSPTAANATNAGDVGAVAAAALPGGSCLAISFRSAGRGRSSRGRNYVSAIPETYAGGNVVGPSFASALVTAYSVLISAPPADWTWVVVSRYTNNAPRAAGVTYPITSVVATNLDIDSQRRRLTGRGS